MIRKFLIALVFSASSAFAQADKPMSLKSCNDAMKAIAELTGNDDLNIVNRISSKGWCAFDGHAIEGLDMDVVEWRARGVENLIYNALMPSELVISVHNQDMLRRFVKDIPETAPAIPAELRLSLLADPDNRQILVRELGVFEPKGNIVVLTGALKNVDLSSRAAMNASLLLATLQDIVVVGSANHNLSRYIAPYLGATFPERSRKKTKMTDDIDSWPDETFPPDTKRAAKQLLAALPAPNGHMHVDLDVGDGLVVGGLILKILGGKTSKLTGTNSLLGDVVLRAKWTPM